MKITCFIRYQIDPLRKDAFRTYARRWFAIIPRCGGALPGYYRENSNFAQSERIILREERTFLGNVEPA